ncbi:hypothetical protein, partial [Citrobacter portucalensis]|uniref:hypothetical protein n=1 Tax=Citrobacter portucalensis TaxID=1639133 RepID=UPI00226B6EF1
MNNRMSAPLRMTSIPSAVEADDGSAVEMRAKPFLSALSSRASWPRSYIDYGSNTVLLTHNRLWNFSPSSPEPMKKEDGVDLGDGAHAFVYGFGDNAETVTPGLESGAAVSAKDGTEVNN